MPSPNEPVSDLRRIRIVECGEPLVDFLQFCPELVFDRPRYKYRRETLARQSVAERLCKAARNLPSGVRLAVIEGWRAPHIQRRMYLAVWDHFRARHPEWSEVALKRVVNRFTAPLDRRVPPPHTTGGAVDVNLVDADGQPLDPCSPYDPFDTRSFPLHAPGLSPAAQQTRQILSEAMLSAGLTNYPSEYWHWSYGDQGWAYRGGHPNAMYGPITPPDYVPSVEEDTDAPLEFVEASIRERRRRWQAE